MNILKEIKKQNNISIHFLAGTILFITTFYLFLPALNSGFIILDDSFYVTKNHMVNTGLTIESIKWAFTNLDGGFWFPLTWLTHMLDCEIYGLNPWGHHLTNLIFHLLNTLLLYHLLQRTTKAQWRSFFVAAVFAIHPLHIEPVVWISSRKDVLSTFFFFLTIIVYVQYVQKKSKLKYILLILVFVCGLMSKSMVITLPFILLLLDYWPFRRMGHNNFHSTPTEKNSKNPDREIKYTYLILEKIPLFILSISAAALTFFAEKKIHAVASIDSFPVKVRISNAVVSYLKYIEKFFSPSGLSVFYPHPGMPSYSTLCISIFILSGLSLWFFKKRNSQPYLIVGWLWYISTLGPVIGLVQIGSHSMADRYTYIPLIGLTVIFTWGTYDLFTFFNLRSRIYMFFTVILLIILFIVSTHQLKYWRNNISLFRHATLVTKNNFVAHNDLGVALAKSGREAEAIAHLNYAMRQPVLRSEANFNLGNAYSALNQTNLAIFHYKKSIEENPTFSDAYLNLGNLYSRIGDFRSAIKYYKKGIKSDPSDSQLYNSLAVIMAKQNKYNEAVNYLREAIRLDSYEHKCTKKPYKNKPKYS